MKMLYRYNEGNHTLHILNGCTNSNNPDYLGFDSEDEAIKYAGRALGVCKVCMDKRDRILREALCKNEQ